MKGKWLMTALAVGAAIFLVIGVLFGFGFAGECTTKTEVHAFIRGASVESESFDLKTEVATVTLALPTKDGVVRATGKGLPNPAHTIAVQRRLMAREAAKANAYAELARILEGLYVKSNCPK